MLVLPTLLLLATQMPDAALGDPAECRIVVDDMGAVGYRIGDAQQIAETVVSGLRKRAGHTAVVYEGSYISDKKLKKMLGPGGENEIQEQKLEYYEKAIKNAKFRVRARFGKKGKTHFATLTCRNSSAPPEKTLESARFEAANFRELREKVHTAIPTFCPLMDPPRAPGGGGEGSGKWTPRPKKKKEWTLPPPR